MTALPLLATAGSGISINGNALSTPVEILVSMTLLALLPGVLLMVTGFTRILIVLGFVRNALGTPTIPPNQVLVGIVALPDAVRDGADVQADQRRPRSSRT